MVPFWLPTFRREEYQPKDYQKPHITEKKTTFSIGIWVKMSAQAIANALYSI